MRLFLAVTAVAVVIFAANTVYELRQLSNVYVLVPQQSANGNFRRRMMKATIIDHQAPTTPQALLIKSITVK